MSTLCRPFSGAGCPEVIALWRGPAFSGLEGALPAREAGRLDELRVTALEERSAVVSWSGPVGASYRNS
ncbi:hypothetical protein [Streptomyces sp. CB02400]|uniref:hypothetical protein n=1 Tax=unclassified Streptomyces TaxID=2593676 RepID=UPI0011615365|nr:hypothetical protein [Streptomyces sp. CB02400]